MGTKWGQNGGDKAGCPQIEQIRKLSQTELHPKKQAFVPNLSLLCPYFVPTPVPNCTTRRDAKKPHNKAIFNFNEWFLEDKILLYIIKDILYSI